MASIDTKATIRLADVSDASGILKIYRPIVETTSISFEWKCPTVEQMESRIEDCFMRHCWLVCQMKGEVGGYAYSSQFRKREAYGWVSEVSVYVAEKHRRNKVAYALYDALHGVMKLQGYRTSMAVMTTPHPISRSFHINFGFSSMARLKNMGNKFGRWYGIEILRLDLCVMNAPMQTILPVNKLDRAELLRLFSASAQLINQTTNDSF